MIALVTCSSEPARADLVPRSGPGPSLDKVQRSTFRLPASAKVRSSTPSDHSSEFNPYVRPSNSIPNSPKFRLQVPDSRLRTQDFSLAEPTLLAADQGGHPINEGTHVGPWAKPQELGAYGAPCDSGGKIRSRMRSR